VMLVCARPNAAVAISAWTSLACTGNTMRTRADVDPMVTEAVLSRMVQDYLQGGEARQPLASPLYADLRGLPPILMQVGDAEVLLDDTTRVANKARLVASSVRIRAETSCCRGKGSGNASRSNC
jgi:epsilon-lactone hydrolase